MGRPVTFQYTKGSRITPENKSESVYAVNFEDELLYSGCSYISQWCLVLKLTYCLFSICKNISISITGHSSNLRVLQVIMLWKLNIEKWPRCLHKKNICLLELKWLLCVSAFYFPPVLQVTKIKSLFFFWTLQER